MWSSHGNALNGHFPDMETEFLEKLNYETIFLFCTQRAVTAPRSKKLVMKRSLYSSENEKYSNWEQ